MADKTIGSLNPAPGTVDDQNTLFVVQQSGSAYKLDGHAFVTALGTILDGHGGIKTIAKTGTSGTPAVDTYTITYADNTTTTFTVTNGAKGDTGDSSYVHIKYASVQPTKDSDMTDDPSAWMGICSDNNSTAPTSYTAYAWYNIKGTTGPTGTPASLQAAVVEYQASSSGTTVPTGTWTTTVPAVPSNSFLWTRTTITFNSGSPIVAYSVGYQGGSGGGGGGSVNSVNNNGPDVSGNVSLEASDIPTSDSSDVQAKLTAFASQISGLDTTVQSKAAQTDLDALEDVVDGKVSSSEVVLKDGSTIVVWSSSTKNINDLYTGVVLCNENVQNTPSATWWLIVSAGQADTRTQIAYSLFNSVVPKIRAKANNTWGSWADINYTKPKLASVTLSGTWSGSGPYTQTVTVSGATITANTKVDVQPNATLLAAMVNAGCTALFIQNNNGTLTAYAIGAAPNSSSTAVQVTCYETA